jgi:hypothetical protein
MMSPPQRVYFRRAFTKMSLPSRSSSGSSSTGRTRRSGCSFSGAPAAWHHAVRLFPFSQSSRGQLSPGARDAGFGFVSISGAAWP